MTVGLGFSICSSYLKVVERIKNEITASLALHTSFIAEHSINASCYYYFNMD
jgi:hypothetical protein